MTERNEQFKRALATAGIGTWAWTLATDQVEVDAQEAVLFGRAPEELRAAGAFFACVHPDDRSRLQAAIEAVRDTVGEYEQAFRILRPDGQVRWLSGRGWYVRDEEGRPVRMLGVSIDITGQKQAEEALHEREAHFRQVSGLLSDYAYAIRIHPDGRAEREWTTGNFAAITDYSVEEYDAAGGIQAHLHPDDQTAFAQWTAALQEGKTATAELRIRTRDGSYRWISNRAYTEFNDAGQVVRVVGSSTNITERKEAEQAIRASEARFRGLADAAPMLVWVSGLDKQNDYFNSGWLEFTGRSIEEERGDGWLEGIHPDDRDRCTSTCLNAFEAREPFDMEFRLRRHDGVYRWILDRGTPWYTPDGTFLGFIGTCVDIHERRETERNTRFFADLERALQSLSDPDAVMAATARMLGEHLGTDHCAYATVEADEDHFSITGDYARSATRSIAGRFAVSDFGAEALRLMRENRPYVVNDIDAEAPEGLDLAAYRAMEIQAIVCVPLQKDGRFVAGLAVYQRTPRQWMQGEIDLVVTVVNRCWESLERARAEEALRDSEARARLAIEAAQLGTWRYDPVTEHVHLDERMCTIWGQPPDAPTLPLAAVFGRIHPADRERVTAAVGAALDPRSSGHYAIEYRIVRPDGTERWVAANGQAQFSGEGVSRHPLSFVGTALDITERKAAEDAIRESEARVRALLNAIPDVVLVYPIGPDGPEPFLEVNDVAVNTYGFSRDELLRMRVTDLLDAESISVPDALNRLRQDGRARFESVHRARDGRAIPMETVSHYFALNGAETVLSISRDVSERRAAEVALRESEARFRHLAEALPDIVYSTDAEGRVEYLNDRWYAYTGLPLSAGLSWTVGDIVHPEDRPRLATMGRSARQTGDAFEGELRLRRHDGTYRWFLTRMVPVHDLDGRIVRWFGTSTDIHAQKALEAELESRVAVRTAELARTNQTLEARNRELQDFAYVASHDLQEPLRKIRTFANLLVTDFGVSLNDEAQHYIARMQDAAGRMSRLITDLLAFSRVSTQGQAFVPVDLNAVTRAVLSDLEVSVREAGGTVEVGALPVVEADPTQMRQLVQNLLGNALKYRREDVPPRVRVQGSIENDPAQPHTPVARFVVEDNGIGFEEKYAERIFAPFQRLHGRGQYEGTGIGLAICRKIVERHGGTITAHSTLGEGATFVITLPVLQPEYEPGTS